jgi:site-specific DNA recombinase
MKSVIIYTRVSTEDQAREGVSLIAQREACAMLCKLRGYADHETVEDAGQSAKSLNRTGITRILTGIEAGQIKALVVWRLDRLTRNLRDLLDLVELFDQHQVALVSVMEQLDTSSPMGRLMLSMLGAVAQWERESIAERVKLGIRHRQAQGGWTGGHKPAATDIEGGPGTRKLVPHPQWGKIASAAWSHIARGKTLTAVAAWLTQQGVPAPLSGKRTKIANWNKQNLGKWLANERLIGVLVERGPFEACQQALAARSSPKNNGGEKIAHRTARDRIWRLAGLARCGHCGSMLANSTSYGRDGEPRYYLRCIRRLKGKGCTAPDLAAQPWEDAVVESLVKSGHGQGDLLRYLEERSREQRARELPARERKKTLTHERERTRAKLDRLIALVEDDSNALKTVGPNIAARQQELDDLDRDIAICNAELAAAGIAATSAEYVIDKLRSRLVTLNEEPWEIQQTTLTAIIWEVFIAEDKNIRIVFRWPIGDPTNGPGNKNNDGQPPTHSANSAHSVNLTAVIKSPPSDAKITNHQSASVKNNTTVGSYRGSSWRRGRDSNPRLSCPNAGFRNRCLQPLSHLSRSFCGEGFLWLLWVLASG